MNATALKQTIDDAWEKREEISVDLKSVHSLQQSIKPGGRHNILIGRERVT